MIGKIAAALLLMTGAAMAETFESCQTVQDAGARLSCFDRIPKTGEPVQEGWQLRTEVDPMTDAIRTIFSISGVGVPACSTRNEIPVLEAYCAEASKTWFVRIKQRCPVRGDDLNFLTRYDADPAKPEKFSATGAWYDFQATVPGSMQIISKLLTAERYLVRVEPSNDYPETLEFRVGGLLPLLTESGTSCKISG